MISCNALRYRVVPLLFAVLTGFLALARRLFLLRGDDFKVM
ncbi:MAG: hypothetical protein ACE5GZ_08705 [Gammaproteobacteria bacterium]